jgi:hypothetical protein
MSTPLYPLTSQRLQEEARPLKDRVSAWRFFDEKGIDITTHDGKRVAISGVKFSGSTKRVFWSGFFEPFIVAAATNTLNWLWEECVSRNLEPPAYFDEAKLLTRQLVTTTYQDIARTDQLLRGEGCPDSVTPVDVRGKIAKMIDYVDSISSAIQHRVAECPAVLPTEDIIELRPNVGGIGVNLNALFRWVCSRLPR